MNFNKWIKIISLGISISLLIASFTQQCYCTTDRCADSLAIFFFGVLGFWFSWAGASWLAIPLLIASLILINRNPKMSFITSLLATILCFSFLAFREIMDNESGYLSQIISYELGYWLWASSALTMFVGNSISYFLKPSAIERENI